MDKDVCLEKLKGIHDDLMQLLDDLKFLADVNYWGDGDYCDAHNSLNKALLKEYNELVDKYNALVGE